MADFNLESNNAFKIVYWGAGGSGKTTILETMYRLSEESEINIYPLSKITKIAKKNGATLYFDRCFFSSLEHENIKYQIFTVAGQGSFFPLREKIFQGAHGVIFVVDSQWDVFDENIDSLKELKEITDGKLIKNIPFIVMLNKQDLPDVIKPHDFKKVLKKERLWYNSDHPLYSWNPIIYETCALYNKNMNISSSFSECIKRTLLYHLKGNGNAPEFSSKDEISLPL